MVLSHVQKHGIIFVNVQKHGTDGTYSTQKTLYNTGSEVCRNQCYH